MLEGGRVAYPWVNQRPPPKAPSNVRLLGYNGNIDRALIKKCVKICSRKGKTTCFSLTLPAGFANSDVEILNSSLTSEIVRAGRRGVACGCLDTK